MQRDSRPAGILACGVRVFEAGVEGAIDRGREESRAVQRRKARLQRRQIDRRRRRAARIYRLLKSFGLLPPATTLTERVAALQRLDRDLSAKHADHVHLLYTLRAKALHEPLGPLEIGRALFHLAQRRGSASNRKDCGASEEERGNVTKAIGELAQELAGRTLAEYFSTLDPHQCRARQRYTHRSMYLDEFGRIWTAQQIHHPDLLTETARKMLSDAMFFQRPLKDQKDLIGECKILPGEKRARAWHPLAQRFRILQQVNNLRIAGQPLDKEDRRIVCERLYDGDLETKELKKLLGLSCNADMNLERGPKKLLIGDRTSEKMRAAFCQGWDCLSPQEQLETIEDLESNLPKEALHRRAVERWGLNEVDADAYAKTVLLDSGKYINFSLKAIERLLPLMEQGLSTTEARDKVFPDHRTQYKTPIQINLPPVRDLLKSEIRNPAVLRSLTELRRVVNELLRRFGNKPEEIHIELARNLKASRSEREEGWRRNEAREKERKEAAIKILNEVGITKPSDEDTKRWLLFEECGGICPYTGREINAQTLFSGEVQIEHIIPFARSLDDSFSNLTLCYVSENARKSNRSPRETYEHTSEWEQILQRVERFQGQYRNTKLRRFKMSTEEIDKVLEKFPSRALNDTRYASKLAARYVSCLYGGLSDADGNLRVFATSGRVTAKLRKLWQIEGLLSDSPFKNRGDHRHHAIDAIVIALTGMDTVRRFALEASRAAERGQPRLRSLEAPCNGDHFREEVERAIQNIIVSWRVDRKVGGPMHDANPAGIIRHPGNGKEIAVRRKYVHQLSKNEIEQIIDPTIQECVKQALALSGGDPKKLEGIVFMPSGVPIRRVRIRTNTARTIGTEFRKRAVTGGETHHFEIIRRGSRFDFVSVSTRDAMDRLSVLKRLRGLADRGSTEAAEQLRRATPLIQREHEGAEFVCSICKKDSFEIIRENGRKDIVVIRTLAADRFRFQQVNDALTEQLENATPNVFFGKLKARKITVSHTGLVIPCNEASR